MASTLLEGGTTGSSRNADIAPDPQGELAACGGLPSTLGPVGTCPGDPLPAGIVVISDVIMDGGPDRIFPYHSPSGLRTVILSGFLTQVGVPRPVSSSEQRPAVPTATVVLMFWAAIFRF